MIIVEGKVSHPLPTGNWRIPLFQKNLRLLRDHRVRLTARLAQVIKDPNHILGKFFSQHDFSGDHDFMDVLGTKFIANFLYMSYRTFIGLTEERAAVADRALFAFICAAGRANEAGTEVAAQLPPEAIVILKQGEDMAIARIRSDEPPVFDLTPALEGLRANLPPDYPDIIRRSEEALAGIPEEHLDIQITASVREDGKIVLDYIKISAEALFVT